MSFEQFWRRRKPPSDPKKRSSRPELECLEDRTVLSIALSGVPTWTAEGPTQEIQGGSAVAPNDPVSGAVESIAVNPNNPSQVIIGTVNGGVWRTTNANASNPSAVTWTPLTDQLGSLAIGAVAYDPSDPTGNTFYAGTGLWSDSFAAGGPAIGLYKTTNGGVSWTELGQNALSGHRVKSLIVSGSTILVGTIDGNGIEYGVNAGETTRDYSELGGALFLSTDGGATFTQDTGTAANPLPTGAVSSLAQDPNNSQRIFAAIAGEGVFQSVDGGVNWTPFNVGLSNAEGSSDIELATQSIGGVTTLFAGISEGDTLTGVYSTSNFSSGGSWMALAMPPTTLNAGSEFAEKFQLVADPTHAGVVYIDGQAGTGIYRYDPAGAGNWVLIDQSGTLSNTSPAPDSRDLQFLGSNMLLEADDGGIYLMNFPTSAADEDWQSFNGNLNTNELYSAAYDPTNQEVIAAAQSNGVSNQDSPGSPTWTDLTGGDGQEVQVDSTSQGGDVLRYELANNWSYFSRFRFDSAGNLLNTGQGTITGATNSNPIVITSIDNGLQTGDQVLISGVLGDTAANGFFTITVVDANDFTLDGSSGNGNYAGSGTWQRLGAITQVAGAAGSPVVITSPNNRLITGDQVYLQGLTGNTALNGSSYYVTVIDANTFSLNGTSADGSSTVGGYWSLSNTVLLKSSIGAANLSGLSTADRENLPSLFAQPFALNNVDPTHMMLGYVGLYEDAGLSTAAGGYAGDVIANISATAPNLNGNPATSQGLVSAIVYGGWIGATPYENIAIVGTTSGQLFFRANNQTEFTDLSADVSGGGEGDIESIAVNPQDYRQVYVLNGDQLWFTPDITNLAANPFRIIGGGPNDNLGQITAQLSSVTVVVVGGVGVPLVGGLGGVFRLLTPPAGADAQATWSKYGQGLPNTVARNLSYDDGSDTLTVATFGRGAWTIASVSTTLGQSGVLTVSSDGHSNLGMDLQVDPANPAWILVSDGLGNVQTFDPTDLSEIIFDEGASGDTAFLGSTGPSGTNETLSFINFLVTVDGGDGAGDGVVLQDAGAAQGSQVTVTATTVGAGVGDNLFGPDGSLAYSDLPVLTLDLSNSGSPGNVVDVESTAASTITNLVGGSGGNNVFNVSSNPGNPSAGNTAGIQGQLRINGGAGTFNRLLVSNAGGASMGMVTVSYNLITGLAPAQIVYTAAGGFNDPTGSIDGISLQGSASNANVFLITSTLAGSTIHVAGGAANDTFTVSSDPNPTLGTVNFIQGRLSIDAEGGTLNRLIVSNLGGGGKPAVFITSSSIINFAPAEIDYAATGGSFGDPAAMDGILIRGSATAATGFEIQSTLAGSTTEVLGGAGDDAFNVDSNAPLLTGNLLGILGPLLVDGGGGNNSLNVSEANSTHNDVITLTGTQISSQVAPFTISYQATGGTFLNGIRLLLGSANETLNVLSALANNLTTIFPGAGTDNINVSVNRTSAYTLYVDGGSGTTQLNVSDTVGGAVAHNHVFGANVGTVEFSYLQGTSSFIDYQGVGAVVTNPTANQSFLQSLYHQYLNRNASSQEIAAWLPILQASGQAAVAADIIKSTEALTIVVDGWYVHDLGRAASAAEAAVWVAKLQAGATQELVLSCFLSAPEYAQRVSTGGLVQALFQTILGRTPSAAEATMWTQTLNAYGVGETAYLLFNSAEYRSDIVLALYNHSLDRGIMVPATLPHKTLFGQPVTTTDPAVAAWVSSTIDVFTLAVDFAATQEFFNDAD